MGRSKIRFETGQVGKFIVALALLVPLMAFIAEILRPGYIARTVSGIWVWLIVLPMLGVAILLIKSRIEG